MVGSSHLTVKRSELEEALVKHVLMIGMVGSGSKAAVH